MAAKILIPKLEALVPRALPNYRAALACINTTLVPFGILNNRLRALHFLAQILHESGGLTVAVENLNYTTPERIKKIWPSRFPTVDSARPYVRNPQKLAMKVYGNRADLGNLTAADGWRFRGRGAIQITGAANYKHFGQALDVDFVSQPDLVIDPQYCLIVAAQYWKERGCNELADKDDIRAVTKRINGAYTGLADRELWLAKVRNVVTTIGVPNALSRKGSPTRSAVAQQLPSRRAVSRKSSKKARKGGKGRRGSSTSSVTKKVPTVLRPRKRRRVRRIR